jgi:hypothetical protein
MKVLTVKLDDLTYEIFMLNIGDVFEGFGGSKHPLTVGREFVTGYREKKPTATMIVRERGPMGLKDTTYDIHDLRIWRWIAALINDTPAEGETVAEVAA